MRYIQFLFATMFLSLNVLAQAPQMQRNFNLSDNGSLDISAIDESRATKFILNDIHDNPIQVGIQSLLRLNEKSINDIKSFVCRNFPTTYNNGSIRYENKVYMSKDNLEISLRLGQSSLQVISATSSSSKTLAIPYSSILFYSLENNELKITLNH